jgi:hypothetical protein
MTTSPGRRGPAGHPQDSEFSPEAAPRTWILPAPSAHPDAVSTPPPDGPPDTDETIPPPRTDRRSLLVGLLAGAAVTALVAAGLWWFRVLPPSAAPGVTLRAESFPAEVMGLRRNPDGEVSGQAEDFFEPNLPMFAWAYGGEGATTVYGEDDAAGTVVVVTAVNGSLEPQVPTSDAEVAEMLSGGVPAYPILKLPGSETTRCSYQWFGAVEGDAIDRDQSVGEFLSGIAGRPFSGYLVCVRNDDRRGFSVSLGYSATDFTTDGASAAATAVRLAAETDRVFAGLVG